MTLRLKTIDLALSAAGVAALFVTACGGDRSTLLSPSPTSARADAVAQTVSSGGISFGGFAAGAARCFQFVGDPVCLSAARVRPTSLVAAAAAPAAPSGLTATVVGTTVTLTWLAPTGTDPVTSYIVEAGSGPGLANLANFSTGSSVTTLTAPGVPAGSYYVRIRASNSGGTSAASNEVLLVVGSSGPGPCTAAPGAPGGLTLVANSGGTVVLTWTAASGSPTTYIVEAGSAPGGSNLANSDLGGTATSLTATGVGAGTYYVRIRARNACGTSGASNEVVLTVSSGPASGLTGNWSGTVTSTGHGAAKTFSIVIPFIQNGDKLTGSPTVNGVSGSLTLQLSTQSGTSATYTGTLDVGAFPGACSPASPFPGSLVVNTAANTMTGSFSGTNTDCLPETDSFALQKQ